AAPRAVRLSWNGHSVHDVVDDHLNRYAMRRRVRSEPDAMAEHVSCELLHVFWKDFVAPMAQQAPHFGEPRPADRGARRRAKVDASLDELRRRMVDPIGFGVVRARRAHEPPDVLG